MSVLAKPIIRPQNEDMATPDAADPKVPFSSRINRSAKDGILAVVRLWQKFAELQGKPDDVVEATDIAFVTTRLINAQVAASFAEWGMNHVPETEAEWDQVFSAMKAGIEKARGPQPKSKK